MLSFLDTSATPLTDDILFKKEEGESLEMSCVAQGEPAPNISWNFQVKEFI